MNRAARTRAPEPPPTLEARLAADLVLTGGKMPIGVIVADDGERVRALRFLAGKKHARLLTVRTAAEAGRRKAGERAETQPPRA